MPGKILLINAPTRDSHRPTGLEYVAEFISKAGYEPDLLDLTLPGETKDSALEHLAQYKYDAIGISVFNTQWDTGRDQVRFFLPEVKAMIADLRQCTKAPVIMGGYGFSLQPADTLRYLEADYGVAGCGVPVFQRLLHLLENGSIERGTILEDESGDYLEYGFARNMVDPKRYDRNTEVLVSTKIGCFEHCSHCPMTRRRFRLRKPERIAEEVANLLGQGVEKISFMHDTFNVPMAHARSICTAIAGLPVQWSAYIYPLPSLLPPELVDVMQRTGMTRADIGGRAIGAEAMLRAYGVQFSVRDMEYATSLFKERGIWTHWFLGFGMPGESKETIDQTFALIDKVAPDDVGILSRTRIYRNAELASVAQRQGIVDPRDPLLEPTYYPFADDLRDYLWEQAGKRSNCSVYY